MKRISSFTAVLFLCVLLALSVTHAPRADTASEKPDPPWVWPLPPERPRVQLIQTVVTPQDLGVQKGFFARLWEFVAGANTMDRIQSPHGVVADGEGKVYVADWGVGRIHYFHFEKKKYDSFTNTKLGPLSSPIGLALDAEGILYVSDSVLRRIFVFKGTKNVRIIGDDSLVRPTGIAVNDAAKLLYVVDTGGHRIDVFGLDGVKRYTFGDHGTREGEFNYPTHIAIDAAGDVYVTDSLNFRIQIFDKDGRFRSQFGGNGTSIRDFMKPKGLAVDSEGHIWVSDSLRNSIQVFDRSGKLLLIFGKLGSGPGQFNLPAGLYMDKKDRLIVADSYNYRVQLFQYLAER
jgi:DNA-binding beta-propeller fold protein YncE